MVSVDPTPNPNALKFTVGVAVGGPVTFTAGSEIENPMAAALLALPGIVSIFMTADFVTLSKTSEASWEGIVEQATEIITEHLGA